MNQGLSTEFGQVMGEANASGLLNALCAIQKPSGQLGLSGAPLGNYVAVADLGFIPCRAAPLRLASLTATEAKALQQIAAKADLHAILNGYYPTIADGWRNGWRAVIDEVAYDIVGVESDANHQMTRLMLTRVTT